MNSLESRIMKFGMESARLSNKSNMGTKLLNRRSTSHTCCNIVSEFLS